MARVSGPVAKPIEPASGEGKGELRGLSCGKEELLPTCSSCPPGGDGERGAGLRGGKGNLVPAVGGREGGLPPCCWRGAAATCRLQPALAWRGRTASPWTRSRCRLTSLDDPSISFLNIWPFRTGLDHLRDRGSCRFNISQFPRSGRRSSAGYFIF